MTILSDREARITRTEETILAARPALERVVRPFARLFRAEARLTQELTADFQPDPPAGHLPALAVLQVPQTLSQKAVKTMTAAAGEVFPVLEGPLKQVGCTLEKIPFSDLAKDYLEGGTAAAAKRTEALDLPPDCLDLVLRLSLSALIKALPEVQGPTSSHLGEKGHCPICGSLPSISFLDRASEEQSEFLKGGGGRKFYHCSLCGHDVATRRHLCPVCGADRPEKLRYYQAEEGSGQRVDACLDCRVYLPCIDLRQAEGPMDMDLAAVGMVHLDILAREKGFSPLTHTLWNRLD